MVLLQEFLHWGNFKKKTEKKSILGILGLIPAYQSFMATA
jgi:hypothetical protein